LSINEETEIMKFRKLLQVAMLLVVTAMGAGAFAQSTVPAKSRVVFQVSDGDAAKWGLALNNASNVQQELGADKVEVEIVAYGPGIGMLLA
jgi:hypothetical protein